MYCAGGDGCMTERHRDLIEVGYYISDRKETRPRGLHMLIRDHCALVIDMCASQPRQFAPSRCTHGRVDQIEHVVAPPNIDNFP